MTKTLSILGMLGCTLLPLVAGCSSTSSSPNTGSPFPDAATDIGEIAPITFPRDESPHSDQIEWWYYTGKLETAGGNVYGFEQVTFQAMVGGAPIYMGHAAVTDLANKTYTLDTKMSTIDQRGASSGFDLDVDGWKMSGHAGNDVLEAAVSGYGFDLALAAKKPVVLQYGRGWMNIGSTLPFYYYSHTQMEATGTLDIAGSPTDVTGTAWMDHQWGTMGEYDGWDWFSLRLDDSTEVMLFTVRQKPQNFSGGTFVDAPGNAQSLTGADFTVMAIDQWTSPHTTSTYPQNWQITIPSIGLDATVTALLADQEFYKTAGSMPTYWEGLCSISGTKQGNAVGGYAYVELTGY
jgi:predicted secreted hydrolase